MARPSLREGIVTAALEEFHTRGFHGTGVKDITDAAGAPKGSFYNHFESKEALAVTALERYGASRRIADLTDETVEPLARLHAHFEFLRDAILDSGMARGCMYGNFGTEIADHSEVIRTAVREGLHTWGDAIAAVVAEAQRTGAVKADLDPAATARFLLNGWEGAIIGARVDRSAESFDAFFRLAFGTILTA
jgi:TetR/AcrR family transcriptional repressor of nem operon